jgi:flagellar hook assembly protein FlgD
VKTLMENVPRSAALNGYQLQSVWDSRYSTGAVVPNGIYWMYLKATDAFGSVRDTSLMSIPVDVLRITDLLTSGISAGQSNAQITYTINGDMLMTILICKTGTTFTNASADGSLTFLSGAFTYNYKTHDPLPLNSGGAVDGSQILRVMKFYRENGAHTETWNGTDQNGSGQTRGIYAMAISGRDDFSNFAVKGSGDDGPIADTLTLDQTAPSVAGGGGGGSLNDFTAPTVTSLTPADGTTVSSVLTGVSAVMVDETGGSGVSGSASSLVVRSSMGVLIQGTTSFTSGVYRLTFTNPLTRADNGVYTMTAIAVDAASNASVPSTGTFTLDVEDPNVFAQDVPIFAYPNPAKNASSVTISANVNRDSTIKLQIFNLLGELVYETQVAALAGAQNLSWDLRNSGGSPISSGLYIYRLVGESTGATQTIVKRLVVVQ